MNSNLYLDYAGSAPIQSSVLVEIEAFNSRYSNCTSPREFINDETRKIEEIRNHIRCWITPSNDYEIVFTRSATEGISLIANGLDWKAGDEIIISEMDHSSNIFPWLYLQERFKCKVSTLRSLNGYIDPDSILKCINKKTKLVSVPLLSHVFGTIQPINKIAEYLSGSEVLLLVDAAQAVGRIPISSLINHCDFLVASGRKALMCPLGIGFICGKRASLNKLRPPFISSRNAKIVNNNLAREAPPLLLEPNLPHLSGIFALKRSVDIVKYNEIDIQKRLSKIVDHIAYGLSRLPDVRLAVDHQPGCEIGIISFACSSRSLQYLYEQLKQKGIFIGYCGTMNINGFEERSYLRVSPGVMISEYEIDHFINVLKNILE